MEYKESKFDIDKYINLLDQFHSFYNSYINPNQNLPESSFDHQAICDLTGAKNEEQYFKKKEKIFGVVIPKIKPPFSNIENESTDTTFEEETTQLKRKRNNCKRRRRDNSDNIRKKIKGAFFNRTLIKEINAILKRHNSKAYFERFPQKFIYDIARESNKKLLNFTLIEIFEKEELYTGCKLNNFYHNFNEIKKDEVRENEELKRILNKKYYELFEEYINSKEFNVYEINRLKEKYDNSYIKSYKNLAKHFIEFFAS